MADGDAAAAAGMAIVSGGADRRDGYKEINKTRDYIVAQAITPLGRLPKRVAVGSFVTVALAASATATATITYPAGRFTVAPALFVESGHGRVTAEITANSATGATVIMGNFTGGASSQKTSQWMAAQMTDTAAIG